ncbi:hypothetical protein B5P43_31805 [Bacillus sp. SRB_336]|nr:hypothetical protein B5P43_31805 [Bacillus sp. SRB_336]
MNQCKATAKGTGAQCKRATEDGATVCHVHGGAAAQVKTKAARVRAARAVEADARAVLALMDTPPVDNALEAMAGLAGEVLAMKNALAARVNALGSLTATSPQGLEVLRVEVQLYERAIDRSAKMLGILARAGFDERRVSVTEAQALMMAAAMANTLRRADIPDEYRAELAEIMVDELHHMDTNTDTKGTP